MGFTFVAVAGLVGGLVDDGAVLETAEIEHAHTAVGATTDEDVYASGTEADIEDFLVVGNQLRLCGE